MNLTPFNLYKDGRAAAHNRKHGHQHIYSINILDIIYMWLNKGKDSNSIYFSRR